MHHAQRLVEPGATTIRRALERRPWIRPVVARHHGEEEAPYTVLSPPLVTLYVTPMRPEDSRRAFDLLISSRTGFRVERAPDDCVAAEFAGELQRGITGVAKLRDALVHFGQTLLQPGPDLDPLIARMRYPGTQAAAEQELQRQFDVARDQLTRVLH